ncbi:MAG: SRPBCC family protein [Gemmatimonadales bacterium]
MPLKHEGDRRWVEMEFLVPGTPEQIWDAVATGPGMTAWFTPTTVEERAGGAIEFDFGGGATSSGKVTVWEPPLRLVYEEYGWSGDAPPVATEVTVETRSRGRCVVRIVHSMFTTDDQWDEQFDGFESGWPGFIEVLRIYLSQHAGAKAAVVRAPAIYAGSSNHAWSALSGALGLAGLDRGARWDAPAGLPPCGGVIERIHQDAASQDVMIRVEQPLPGVALVGAYRWEAQTRVVVIFYWYGDGAAELAERIEPAWVDWMAKRFPV